MKNEEQALQDFTIKGELIGTINLSDTFEKVKDLSQNKERHRFFFVNKKGEFFSHWDLDSVEKEDFPIQVIRPFRKGDTGKDTCVTEIF